MKIYKITAYIYLLFAGVFVYDIYDRIQHGENYTVSVLFLAIAIFMFFFRMRTAKKAEQNRNN
ncbi:hypothetical protein AB4865_04940 [Capnocytophaga sp. ARDL2]|uniref:hypothetical protein n=1 Tax=Capnocytophaga sp. ARDL2 TaxID=3238809 RepID=UPI003558D654